MAVWVLLVCKCGEILTGHSYSSSDMGSYLNKEIS